MSGRKENKGKRGDHMGNGCWETRGVGIFLLFFLCFLLPQRLLIMEAKRSTENILAEG